MKLECKNGNKAVIIQTSGRGPSGLFFLEGLIAAPQQGSSFHEMLSGERGRVSRGLVEHEALPSARTSPGA